MDDSASREKSETAQKTHHSDTDDGHFVHLYRFRIWNKRNQQPGGTKVTNCDLYGRELAAAGRTQRGAIAAIRSTARRNWVVELANEKRRNVSPNEPNAAPGIPATPASSSSRPATSAAGRGGGGGREGKPPNTTP